MLARMFLPLSIALLWVAQPAPAHEFWIEPHQFQAQNGVPLQADLRNGQKFSGLSLPYFDTRIARFEVISPAGTAPVAGRLGDIPALQNVTPPDGLAVILHQTQAETLTYKDWDKFQAFADHKGFADIQARHQARGLPRDGFVETYTRFAKALVGIGEARGQDMQTGMLTEFVALTNPYTDDLTDGVLVQVLFDNAPRARAQVEIFDRAPDGSVAVTITHADDNGRALIPATPGHIYLLDAVVLRPVDGPDGAVWESLWAALTYRVPD